MAVDTKITPGIYEHYKGGRYEVIGVGIFETTEEPVVIYKALYENEMSDFWITPDPSLEETVTVDNVEVPRFRRVD